MLLAALSSTALTLGRTRGAALIGRPLELSIQVRLDPAEENTTQCFDADVFHADSKVDSSRVSVQLQPGSTPQDAILRIRSSATVDEPVVTVYLRAGCTQRVTRRYVLLADFPTETVAPAPAVPSVPAVVLPAPVAVPARPAAAASSATPARASGGPGTATPAGPAASSKPKPAAEEGEPAAAPRPRRPRVAAAAKAEPQIAAKRAEPLPAKRKAEAPARPSRSRLKLEPLDLLIERDPTLKASTEMLSAPAATDDQRALAAALWRALNAQPQDVLRDAQRIQALEADVKGLRELTARNQSSLTELRGQLQKAEDERYANGLVYALAALLLVALAGAGYLWQRGRSGLPSASDWWRRDDTAGGDLGQYDGDSLVAPLPAKTTTATASKSAVVDVDLDVDESMFATLKTARPVVPVAPPSDSLPPIDHVDFAASITGASRAVNAEELFDIQQQADFFLSLGQHDQAIEVLKNHISDNVETSALAYLDLLKIYHSLSRQDDYELLRADFNKVFNAEVPPFEAFSDSSSGLEAYHNALSRIEALWPSPKVLEIIEESIFRKPGSGDGEAFDLEAYRELLLLYAMAKDVVERGGGLMDFDMSGLSTPPDVDSQMQPRFSATSIQPLSASMDPSLPDSTPGDEDDDGVPLPHIAMPRPSPRLGLDIDLSEPVPLTSAFMEIGLDETPAQERDPHPSRDSEAADSGKPQDSNLIDFDLFDAATERDIAPRRPPKG